jgi:hypothetical protein
MSQSVQNVEADNAGAILLEANLQTIANYIRLDLHMLPRCAVASENLAAAVQAQAEHTAAAIHTSRQQLKSNATAGCRTM